MTAPIPKRPEHEPEKLHDGHWRYRYHNGELNGGKIDCMWWHESEVSRHEHAVAVRAVEALREISALFIEALGKGEEATGELVNRLVAPAPKALREIEQSGWKP